MPRNTPYSPEVRERAVRMYLEHRSEYRSEWATMTSIAGKLGMTAETLRHWVRRYEIDGGMRPGLSTDERRRLARARKGEPRAPPGERDLEGGVGFFRGRARRSSKRSRFLRRPAEGSIRSRADLCGVAVRSVHLLRGEMPPAIGEIAP